MLKKWKNFLLYAGVDHHSFERVKPKIQQTNTIMTTVLSSFAALLIATMFLFSFLSEGIKQNQMVYLIGLIVSSVISLISMTIAKKNTWIASFLIYLSYTIYFLYGIFIGTITDPDGKTVTFMVLLVFMNILFINRPINSIIITGIHVFLFIILCKINKTGAVLSVDIIDAIVFGILGSTSGAIVNHMKVRGYVLEQSLQEISRIDQLTQMRNRNAYEFEHNSIPDLCKHSLGCIYIDVNGLHEANNANGHQYGDEMLKHIAAQIKYAFTNELSFRIGGDEFIAFAPDKSLEEVEKTVREMVEKIEINDYHVAVGYEVAKVRHLSIENLIKDAEGKMFRDKNQYYKNIVNREIRN